MNLVENNNNENTKGRKLRPLYSCIRTFYEEMKFQECLVSAPYFHLLQLFARWKRFYLRCLSRRKWSVGKCMHKYLSHIESSSSITTQKMAKEKMYCNRPSITMLKIFKIFHQTGWSLLKNKETNSDIFVKLKQKK